VDGCLDPPDPTDDGERITEERVLAAEDEVAREHEALRAPDATALHRSDGRLHEVADELQLVPLRHGIGSGRRGAMRTVEQGAGAEVLPDRPQHEHPRVGVDRTLLPSLLELVVQQRVVGIERWSIEGDGTDAVRGLVAHELRLVGQRISSAVLRRGGRYRRRPPSARGAGHASKRGSRVAVVIGTVRRLSQVPRRG